MDQQNKNMEDTNLIIKQQFDQLPSEVQRALISFDWKKEVKNISNELLLTSEQSIDLETEVLLLIYSFEPQENFYNNLLYKVGLTADIAEKGFNLVEEKILKPLTSVVEEGAPTPLMTDNTLTTSHQELVGTPQVEPIINPADQTLEERKKVVSIPDYSKYESGKDPYREPIE
jgi:hypothetical protein